MNPDLTEKRPIFLIGGCRKYQEFLTAAAVRMRRDDAWRLVTVVGNGSEAEATFDGTLLTLPVNDNYESLPLKLQTAYTWVYHHFPNSPGIWKTDEDILYDDLKVLHRTLQKNKDKAYWGLVSQKCPAADVEMKRIQGRFEDKTLRPKHQMAHYCFGAGYWLSRQALRHILDAADEYKRSCLEDVCTGYVLNKKGIKPAVISPIQWKEAPRNAALLALSSE